MRNVLQLELEGAALFGTYHRPQSQGVRSAHVGVLLFNSGFLPRSAPGDALAHLSDRLAEEGYPVFRFDLPGLGDSPGRLPEQIPDLFREIHGGGYGQVAASLTLELIRRFHLDGMVLGGNCGGAITALYAGAKIPAAVRGLILLDPAFSLIDHPPSGRSRDGRDDEKRLADVRQWVRAGWTGLKQVPGLTPVRARYNRFRRSRDKRRGARLPPTANLPLIDCFGKLAVGTPVLFVAARAGEAAVGYAFDYLPYFRSNLGGQVEFVELTGTNHSFVEGRGKQAVGGIIQEWLARRVPAITSGQQFSASNSGGDNGRIDLPP